MEGLARQSLLIPGSTNLKDFYLKKKKKCINLGRKNTGLTEKPSYNMMDKSEFRLTLAPGSLARMDRAAANEAVPPPIRR